MTDPSPPDGLLDRAGNAFTLAESLAAALEEQSQGRRGKVGAADKSRFAKDMDGLGAALADLGDVIQRPAEGFAAVAAPLLEAGRIRNEIGAAIGRPEGLVWADLRRLIPQLNEACNTGRQRIAEASELKSDSNFGGGEKPDFSLLDRYPATPDGHIKFLEWVCGEVHYSAEARRKQFDRGYSDATLTSMIGGIKWVESGKRIAALSDLPQDVVQRVSRVLKRQLQVGTVERIDELLTPAVQSLRDTWEDRDLPPGDQAGDDIPDSEQRLGRKKADYKTVRKVAEVADEWRREEESPVAAATSTDTKMAERDKWIYTKRKAGLRNQTVIEKLGEIFVARGWEAISSAGGVRAAVKRHCLRTGDPMLANVKGGRPKRKNPTVKTAQ